MNACFRVTCEVAMRSEWYVHSFTSSCFQFFNIIYLGIIVITLYFFCLTFQRPDDLFPKVLIPSSILTSSGMGF